MYEGVDLRLRRPVAVKVFRPGGDPVLRERFADEAVALAGLQHPGLVTLYDAGRYDDCAYLVMQLVKGTTLSRRIAAGALEPAYVVELGLGLARALAHVHAAGIVHRDVKPSNVLLDASGAPYLADFGISRMVSATRHTASGELLGTAAYLAPEQVQGRVVGPPADVYALGLVLLEGLKGHMEYQGTPLEAAVARMHRRPTVPEFVPAELARLLHAMTALEETARPDAEECAEVLAFLGSSGFGSLSGTAAGRVRAVGCAIPDRTTSPGGPGKRWRRSAPAPAGPGTRRQRGPGAGRPRRVLATGTAVLTAVLGATFAVSLDAEGAGDDRAAPGSLESAPAQTPPSAASPRAGNRSEDRRQAVPATPHASQTSPARTSPASYEALRKPPSSSPAAADRTAPRRGNEQDDTSRPGGAQHSDRTSMEQAAKEKGGAVAKRHR
ncbi:protein kinase [Streptomyces sp. NPDC005931]|uniref:serine/threonine-protein kinase n=1 Tax=Streptomyces sp. NPDC005931 TaxID=3364737 RepID=UPI0036C19539